MTKGKLKKIIEEDIIPTVLKTEKTERTGKLPEHSYAMHLNRKGSVKNRKAVARGEPPEYYECDNLHIHIIHSERLRQPPTGKWTRDVYFTDAGIQARNASERAKDKNGNDLPPVHRKGEAKGHFSLKDEEYAGGKWLEYTKKAVKETIEDLGYEYERRKYFPRAKLGRGKAYDKNGKLTRYGRVKKENELFEKAEDLMGFFESRGYEFPVCPRDNDGESTPEFLALRSAVLDTLENHYGLELIFIRHAVKKPAITKTAPVQEKPANKKVSTPTATPASPAPAFGYASELFNDSGGARDTYSTVKDDAVRQKARTRTEPAKAAAPISKHIPAQSEFEKKQPPLNEKTADLTAAEIAAQQARVLARREKIAKGAQAAVAKKRALDALKFGESPALKTPTGSPSAATTIRQPGE
jgi:hypothetical protein